ncbi:MAG: hypothetical protein IH577_01645 [Deltaproteobacteria bacterium]|nr:hypothetical protein [Deltaproteobacteria bacterium]
MEIKVDIQGLEATTKNIFNIEKQVRYAGAVALTRTAQEVQAATIANIRRDFTVRGSWLRAGGRFGVGIQRATKDNLQAVVENRAPWLEAHEEGETRTPRGQHFAIAQPEVRRTKTEVIAKAQRPTRLKRAFKVETDSGVPLLLQRVGRGARSLLRVMYQMTDRAKIRPELNFVKQGRVIVFKVWKRNFDEALAQALKTAR